MPQFFATTSRGLSEVLEKELQSLGFKGIKSELGGVWFETNWKGCYLANLKLRTASRVLLPVLDFPAYQPEELYQNVFKKHDFTKYFSLKDTFSVDANVRESSFKDQRFIALKVKDAVVDQFREKFGERPNVSTQTPDVRVIVRIVKNQVSIAMDTSGDTLSNRGYRLQSGEAPLREHLAAGLLELAEWDGQTPLVDLMCGSGTILIEAALRASAIAPGSLRKRFAFQKFIGFDKEAWEEAVDQVVSEEKECEVPIYGFDINGKILSAAKSNAVRAGVDTAIQFQKSAVDLVEPPCEKGLIIINPPYGERLGDVESVKDVYRDLAFILKSKFKGWTCWLLSGNHEMTQALKLKSTRRIPVFNGNIECRFLKYEIR